MAGIFDSIIGSIKKRMKAGASGRKRSLDHAIGEQSQGRKTPGSTLGNPGGNRKKKKKRNLNDGMNP